MIRITNIPDPVDIPWLGRNLRRTYWANGLTDEQIAEALKGSLHFWAIEYDGEIAWPVGFARVVTDGVITSMVTDFFIVQHRQNEGIGTMLMEHILDHKDVKRTACVLASRDAATFYEKFGFKRNMDPLLVRYMP